MKTLFILSLSLLHFGVFCQTSTELLNKVVSKINTVKDYSATAKISANIPMIKILPSQATIYFKQKKEPWPYSEKEHPVALQPWDQFTFWKILNVDKFPLKVTFFKDDARWNFVNGYFLTETKNPIIFYHHTIPSKLVI